MTLQGNYFQSLEFTFLTNKTSKLDRGKEVHFTRI